MTFAILSTFLPAGCGLFNCLYMYIIYVSNYEWSGESHDLIEWMQYISCLPFVISQCHILAACTLVFIVIVVTTDIEALLYVG